MPALQRVGSAVVLFQPRGVGFADACAAADGRYEVDTIHTDGRVETETIRLRGVGSLGRDADRRAFFTLPTSLPTLRYVGLGVTDAGFVADSAAMRDLAQFLCACHKWIPANTISILNTDNVPSNGEKIRACVLDAQWPERPRDDAWTAFVAYLDTHVHFHNTMVDRLTSHRPTDALVPLAEPWPSKVLAIQDEGAVLESDLFCTIPGVVIRTSNAELLLDQKLKLRIANATSSALVYVLSLSRFKTNNEARALPEVLAYRDGLFYCDILPSLVGEGVAHDVAVGVYDEWTRRSSHAHFGLVNLSVTQNAWMHIHACLFGTIRANVTRDPAHRASAFMTGRRMGVQRRTQSRSDARGDEFVDAPAYPIAAVLADAATTASQLESDKNKIQELYQRIVRQIIGHVPGLSLAEPAYSAFADDVASMYSTLLRGMTGEQDASALGVLTRVVAENGTLG